MITAVCKIRNYGLTWIACDFADHHTENLDIFEVNAWVNLELYGTLVGGAKNGWPHCTYLLPSRTRYRYFRTLKVPFFLVLLSKDPKGLYLNLNLGRYQVMVLLLPY